MFGLKRHDDDDQVPFGIENQNDSFDDPLSSIEGKDQPPTDSGDYREQVAGEMTAQSIREVCFPLVRGRIAYDTDDVDNKFDQIALQWEAVEQGALAAPVLAEQIGTLQFTRANFLMEGYQRKSVDQFLLQLRNALLLQDK